MPTFAVIRRRFWRFLLATLLLVAVFGASLQQSAPTAHAGGLTIQVTGSGDPAIGDPANCLLSAGSGNCASLRDALAASSNGTTITFAPAVNSIALSNTLAITNNVTIAGPGPNLLTVSGDSAQDFTVFTVPATVTATIAGMTITNGGANVTTNYDGGGIYNTGALTVTNVALFNNVADSGGAIFNEETNVLPSGTLYVTATTVISNFAYAGGGIENSDGYASILNTTVYSNLALYLGGGVLGGEALTLISNTTIYSNTELDSRYFVAIGAPIGADKIGIFGGGGVFNAGLMGIINTSIFSNQAGVVNQGGGLVPAYPLLQHSNTLAVQGVNHKAQLASTHAFVVPTSTLPAAMISRYGPTAPTLTQHSLAALILAHPQFLPTMPRTSDGIITNAPVNFAGGGAVLNIGSLYVLQTSVYGNFAPIGGAFSNVSASMLSIVNTTIYTNISIFEGSAVFAAGGSTTALTNTTVYKNESYDGEQIGVFDGAAVTLSNTVLASDFTTDCYADTNTPVGTITDKGGVVVDDGSCASAPNSLSNVDDSQLPFGPLQNNGGPTPTLALLLGNVAIGEAVGSVCQMFPVNAIDQRGYPRPATHCDSGAFQTSSPCVVTGVISVQYEGFVSIQRLMGMTSGQGVVVATYKGPLAKSGVVTFNHPLIQYCSASGALVTGTSGGTGTVYPLGDALQATITLSGMTATVSLSDTTHPQPQPIVYTARKPYWTLSTNPIP